MKVSDYRWLTPLSQQFLEADYLLPQQTLDSRVDTICEAAEHRLKRPGFAARLKAGIQRGWFSLSTPIWTNFGTDRGLPISCYGSTTADDMASILEAHAEIGMMTKHGGGTAIYFGEVRGRGADIRNNGRSSGSVHFAKLFDTLITTVSQGQVRRGNCAAYWPIRHPDIREVLTLRTEGNPVQDLSYGVCVDDQWMEEMIAGDRDKREVWAKVLSSRQNTGYPYLFFTDNANNGAPDVYRDRGYRINHSQLCVTGDQRVVSSRGIKTAKQLAEEGGELTLFDNEKVVKATPMRLIEKGADVYRITLDNGMTHTVTGYHKVKTKKGDVACSDLEVGTEVAVQTNRGLFGEGHCPDEALLLGFYQGDGTQTTDAVAIDVWERNFDFLDEIQERFDRVYARHNLNEGSNGRVYNTPTFHSCNTGTSTVEKRRLIGRGLKKLGFRKGVIPDWIWEANEETQWQYVRGLLLTDGTVFVGSSKGSPLQLSVSSVDRSFLQQVQILLANLGIKTSIRLLREAGTSLLPDGRGGQKEYQSQDCWRLIVSNKPDAIRINTHTGFLDHKGVEVEDREYRDNTKKFFAVAAIEHIGKEDVYCCTVDTDEHHFVCNGVVTRNCSEVMLPTAFDESFVCCLASMNVLHFDEWKSTDAVETLSYLLDAVMSEFIEKAQSIPYLHRAVKFARRHRALGIGQLGWHSYLQSKMVPFESMEAKRLNVAVAKSIKKTAELASQKMAVEYGEPEVCKGYFRRNTTMLAIAPTKSSAFILGQVSEGIEPHRSNYFIKDLAKGKFTIKNSHLEQLLESKGENTAAVWDSILKKGGSVQHLPVLTDHEKAVFKTFSEISPMEVVQQAAARQKYIDQGQSLNLMISPQIPVKDVNALVIEAWRLGLKSLYYQIGVSAAQQFSRDILSCSSCES